MTPPPVTAVLLCWSKMWHTSCNWNNFCFWAAIKFFQTPPSWFLPRSKMSSEWKFIYSSNRTRHNPSWLIMTKGEKKTSICKAITANQRKLWGSRGSWRAESVAYSSPLFCAIPHEATDEVFVVADVAWMPEWATSGGLQMAAIVADRWAVTSAAAAVDNTSCAS